MLYFYLCSSFVLLSAFIVLKRIKLGRKTYPGSLYVSLSTRRTSKQTVSTKIHVAMGSWLTYLWWGGDPDAVSPRSGLTRREVYAVQQSWTPVYANSVANGTELLKRLFRAYPETKEFFKMLRKSSEDEYEVNPQFKAHVINLMSSLDLAVSNLNQPDVVAAMMNKLGESHGRRKIQEEHFYDLKEVLVKMFVEVLKPEAATLAAWSKTVDFWYKHIFETLSQGDTR